MEDKLKEYGLKLRENDDPDRYEVDFTIEDGEDNVAWVWGYGMSKYKELEPDFECNHPYQCIEFGDEDEQGQCKLCGCYCDWKRVPDEDTPGHPEPTEWYPRRNVGGLIREYLDELLRAKNG